MAAKAFLDILPAKLIKIFKKRKEKLEKSFKMTRKQCIVHLFTYK